MNSEHTENVKNNFFQQMNNSIFRRTMKNVRESRDIKFVTTERRRNFYHTTKMFLKNFLALETKKKKTKKKMYKPVQLGLSIINVRKQQCMRFVIIT